MLGRRLLSAVRHPLSQNAGALYAAQLALTVLPLVTLPWLARALGSAELGLVMFVQAMGSLVGILVGFGFSLSGTRSVARARDDRDAMGETVATVLSGQLVLAMVAAVASVVALVAVPEFRDDPRLPLFAWTMGVFQGLNPTWVLMAVERLRLQAVIEVSIRTLQAVAIVALVRSPDDAVLVLWIWLLGNVLVTAILAGIVYRIVPMRSPRFSAGVTSVRHGWSMFVTYSSVSLYTSGTVFILGLIVSNAQLALFGSAERIVRAAVRASGPVGAVTYPRVNFLISSGKERQAQRLALFTLAARAGMALFTAVVLIALAPLVVDVLLGDQFEDAVPILRVMALLVLLSAISATLSQHWLLSHGRDRQTLHVTIIGGLASMLLATVVGSTVGIAAVPWALVGVQLVVVFTLGALIAREGIGPSLLSRPAAS